MQGESRKRFGCDTCNKSFKNKGGLVQHKNIHSGAYSCETCDGKFSSSTLLKMHERIHTGEKLFACEICQKSFSTADSLRVHCRIHTGEKPFECEICQKKFTYASHLKWHRGIHTGEKPFVCNICQKSFPTTTRLKEHYRVHTGEKPFVCEICYKGFTRRPFLREHRATHAEENSSTFASGHKSKSDTDYDGVQKEKKVYSCETCGRDFGKLSFLKCHQYVHDRDSIKNIELESSLSASNSKEMCTKSFKTKEGVDQHKKARSGAYACETCGVKYTTAYQLKIHKRIHTGEKPFVCEICQKSFVCSSYLRSHRRVHTGEKPFVCEICWKSFAGKNHLRKHRATHAEENSSAFASGNKLESDAVHDGVQEEDKVYSCETCGREFGKLPSLKCHEHVHDEESIEKIKSESLLSTSNSKEMATYSRFMMKNSNTYGRSSKNNTAKD